jgi:hypothetical protein
LAHHLFTADEFDNCNTNTQLLLKNIFLFYHEIRAKHYIFFLLAALKNITFFITLANFLKPIFIFFAQSLNQGFDVGPETGDFLALFIAYALGD